MTKNTTGITKWENQTILDDHHNINPSEETYTQTTIRRSFNERKISDL